MSCEGCDRHNSGIYIAGCRGCAIRDLVRSPEFFASLRACRITPAYAARLSVLGKVEEVHAEVKAAAKQYETGANPQ